MRLNRRIQGVEEAITVADCGSFVAAAERLGLSASALGKSVARLERRIGTRLFHRTTRTVVLTPEGEVWLEGVRDALSGLDEAERLAGRSRGTIEGTIRVGAPVAYGRLHVVPHLASFARLHPAVRFDVRLTDRTVDPLRDRLDVVVRIGGSNSTGLRAERLGRVHLGCFASPDFLTAHGHPRHPDDLLEWPRLSFVMNDGRALDHVFRRDDEEHVLPADGPFECDDAEGVLAAAAAGFGSCFLPTFLAQPVVDTGSLVPVLPDWAIDRYEVRVLVPRSHLVPERVEALVRHLISASAAASGGRNDGR